MENQNPPEHAAAAPQNASALDDLETKMLAVEYEVWLKMHNGPAVTQEPNSDASVTDASAKDAAAAQASKLAALPEKSHAIDNSDSGTEVVHTQDKYKLWAHTKV